MNYSRLELIAMASALHGAQSTSLTGSHVAVPTNHALLAGDMLKEIAETLVEPVAVPDGYVLVPVEPTEQMIMAGSNAAHDVSDKVRWFPAAWIAALAAAPQPDTAKE